MKLRKVLIYISILILSFISLIVLNVLGSKERIGYLGNLNFISSESYSNNYVYSFKVMYYDKVFRNSDIYGVYLNTNSFPKYIKEIKMKDEFGTPFGSLVSIKKLEGEKIDNIKYILKIKSVMISYITLFFIITSLILISNINDIYIKYIHNVNNKHIIIVMIFLFFLIIPKVVYILFYNNFDHRNYENRKLYEYPNINSGIINYFKKYELYFNDHLAFKNELVQLNSIIDYFIFKDFRYSHTQFFYGKYDYQFWKTEIKNYSGETVVTDDELEIIKNNLINFRNELSKYKIDFILMVCPNKSLIYDEYIPNYINKTDFTSTDKILMYLKNNTDIKIVYPKDKLIKYKDKYDLYYQYDAHWNNLGAYIGYTDLLENMGHHDNIINIYDIIINKTYSMTDINRNKYIIRTNKEYFLSKYTKNKFDIIDGKNTYTSYVYTKSNSTNKNILFIKDSFGYYMFNYIASYFKESTFIHIDDFKRLYVDDKNIDIIIFETLESELKLRMLNILPNFEIIKTN